MKKQIFVLSLVLGATFSIPLVTSAEGAATTAGEHSRGGHGHRDPAARVKALKEKLGLSDDQATKIEAIFTERQGKMKSLHADTTLSTQDRHTKAREIMKSSSAQVKALLTPDQLAKYEELQKQHRKGGMHHGGHGKNRSHGNSDAVSAPK